MKYVLKIIITCLMLVFSVSLGFTHIEANDGGWFGESVAGLKHEALKDTKNPYVKDFAEVEDADKTNFHKTLKKETDNAGMLSGFLSIFKIDKYKEEGEGKVPTFIAYLKAIVNIALGLISFIALIMAIYTFYMMFFTDNEAGQKKAKGNMFGIFIAIAIIGLAWIIVSFIFWWYQDNWQNAQLTSYTNQNISYNLVNANIDQTYLIS